MAARDITTPKPPPVIPETAHRLKAGMWESFTAGALAGPVAAALVFGALTASPLLRLRSSQGSAHCRFALLLIRSIPDSLSESGPLFLKRQCD